MATLGVNRSNLYNFFKTQQLSITKGKIHKQIAFLLPTLLLGPVKAC